MKTKNDLTPRQWRLYQFLKESKGYETQEEMLDDYENIILYESLKKCDGIQEQTEYLDKYWYGYNDEFESEIDWNNMTSARALRKDIKALRESDVIQKIVVGTKFAETIDEAKSRLDKTLARILRQLKTYHIEKRKVQNHFQTRMVFNKEKDIINVLNNE